VVGRGQLLELGLSRDAIAGRVRRGQLHQLHPGVYAVGHRAIGREGRWLAAVLFCGPGAVLSHRTAAALWGLTTSGEAIEVTVPRRSSSSRSIRRHYSLLPADEVTVHDGIPVTTVPRTLLDRAATSSPGALERELRESEYLRLHDPLSLPHLLERYPARRGSVAARECLARRRESPGRVRPGLEERFVPFLDRHALPRPRFNALIEVSPKTYEVDCLWLAARQVVELDSWEGHGTRTAFRGDRERDRRLRVAGYGVTRLTWAQLDAEPEAIARDLRVLLSAATSSRDRDLT
jgi:very-short-patch-repair endonuclease